jgi:hypothetical protein
MPQVEVDANDSVAAQQATLDLINASLQNGVSSPALKALVSAWALAVSTDLSSGQPTTYDAGPTSRR